MALGLGYGAVEGFGVLGGGADERVVEGAGTSEADPATPTTRPAATVANPATTAAAVSTTTAAPSGPPSTERPAKVLVVGDSDAASFGPHLKEVLDATGVAATTVDYKVSSGLARPDFFDWPAHLRAELPKVDPDIVVVTFGGNDAQGLALTDGSFLNGDPVAYKEEWLPEYARRAGEVMDLLAGEGRTVVWVGIPNDDSAEISERLAVQNEAVHEALASRPAVRFVDTWTRFASGNGGWAEYVVDPRDGQGKDVRADDGFHLNQAGAEILAIDIADVVKADLRARGATI